LGVTRMERVRFCLVGAGRAGMVHAHNIVSNIIKADLVSVVDSDPTVLKERGEGLGVQALYRDLDEALDSGGFDAVIVVTPTFTHKDIVLKCARAKKHVFCEKPMAVRVSEADEMNREVEKAGVKLQIGFMRRFDPPFLHAKEVIESGALGEPMIIKSVGRGPGLPPPWTYSVKESNGLLGEVNSHDFDSTRWLAGSEYERVYAEASNRKTTHLLVDYPDFYDNVVCTVRFSNGVIGTIDGTCPADYGYDARTEIVLTKGMISIGETNGEAFFSCDSNGLIGRSAHRSWRNRFKHAYLEEMRSFIESIIDDHRPVVTGEDGKAAVAAVVAANRSILDGQPVEI
ncbi:MAG: Gfo/Idh/MocA family oxidoreductase, partial [Spirochaetes bacterium]|nr:Gfo/Idh/MocA family oxidoreductase [Spirochaetota bacterium]